MSDERHDGEAVASTLATLWSELTIGTPTGQYAFILNSGDRGLLGSLDELSAAHASETPPHGGASVAAHVDHVHYGVSLLNRWSAGEDVLSSADYAQSWRRGTVSEEGWRQLRDRLRAEVLRWQTFLERASVSEHSDLTPVVAMLAHLAYHLGAIRQIDRRLRGPAEQG